MNKASKKTRNRLIKAASAVFAKDGYEAASTRRVCERAGANIAAINYHFGDKLGLYKAVISALTDEQHVRLRELASLQGAPEIVLRGFVALMFQTCGAIGRRNQLAAVLAHELSRPTLGLPTIVKQIIIPRVCLLCDLVAKCIGKTAEAEETRLVSQSIIAQYVHFTHSLPVFKLLYPTWRIDARGRSAMIDHIVDFSVAGMHGAISPESAHRPPFSRCHPLRDRRRGSGPSSIKRCRVP